MSKNKHLTLDERNVIEQELAKNTSFKEIAKKLNKDASTISKEVKKHRIKKEGQSFHINFNHCARKYNCHRKNVCSTRCKRDCRTCNKCNNVCPDFVDGLCFKLKRAPFVCNGCFQKDHCRQTKYFYKALSSFNAYKTILSEARQGINMTELELANLDRIISPLIKQRTIYLSYLQNTRYSLY